MRAGGERPSGELATPRPRDGLWDFWHRPGGPLQGDERAIGGTPPKHQGGTEWGGSGKEGKAWETADMRLPWAKDEGDAMTKLANLKQRLLENPEVQEEYTRADAEFSLIEAMIRARRMPD